MASALNNRGLLLSDDGQFDAAEKSLSESLALYRRAVGDNHLLTGQTWYALADNSPAPAISPSRRPRSPTPSGSSGASSTRTTRPSPSR